MPSGSGIDIQALASGQDATVGNLFTPVIASTLSTAFHLLLSHARVAPRYRNANVVSATVCGIAPAMTATLRRRASAAV